MTTRMGGWNRTDAGCFAMSSRASHANAARHKVSTVMAGMRPSASKYVVFESPHAPEGPKMRTMASSTPAMTSTATMSPAAWRCRTLGSAAGAPTAGDGTASFAPDASVAPRRPSAARAASKHAAAKQGRAMATTTCWAGSMKPSSAKLISWRNGNAATMHHTAHANPCVFANRMTKRDANQK